MIYNKARGDAPEGAIYVGRGTPWGNPFKMKNSSDLERDRVCDEHRRWLWEQIKAGAVKLEDLASLHEKDLVCHCAPKRCHAETLLKAAAWAVVELERRAAS